jgi:hypothetical protein
MLTGTPRMGKVGTIDDEIARLGMVCSPLSPRLTTTNV